MFMLGFTSTAPAKKGKKQKDALEEKKKKLAKEKQKLNKIEVEEVQGGLRNSLFCSTLETNTCTNMGVAIQQSCLFLLLFQSFFEPSETCRIIELFLLVFTSSDDEPQLPQLAREIELMFESCGIYEWELDHLSYKRAFVDGFGQTQPCIFISHIIIYLLSYTPAMVFKLLRESERGGWGECGDGSLSCL